MPDQALAAAVDQVMHLGREEAWQANRAPDVPNEQASMWRFGTRGEETARRLDLSRPLAKQRLANDRRA